MRVRYAVDWRLYFWTWRHPLGYTSVYYDGWNNQLNFGFFSINWLTPPLIGDIESSDEPAAPSSEEGQG